MNINQQFLDINPLTFTGKNKKKKVGSRDYSSHERLLRHEINTKAVEYHFNDIYTGNPLTSGSGPLSSSVEHIIAYENRKSKLLPEGFDINGLANFFPVGKQKNMERADKSFKDVVIEDPNVLTRLLDEMPKLEKFNSGIINGKQWRKDLNNTLSIVLTGACSDIKTRKLKFLA